MKLVTSLILRLAVILIRAAPNNSFNHSIAFH
jgi:hypothetical protein